MEKINNNRSNHVDRKNKRKMENEDEEKQKQQQEQEHDQENEEEKMEQFFALIRNTKEMRDRLKNSASGGLNEENRKLEGEKEKAAAARVSAAWNPTFQPEDFMEDAKIIEKFKKNIFYGENQQLGSSSSSRGQEDEKQDAKAEAKNKGNMDLDLNLSL